MLEVSGLTIGTADREIVHGVSFSVDAGEWFAVIGESGSGKSISAHAIGDLLPRSLHRNADALRLGDLDLLTAGRRRLRRELGRSICYVFQNYGAAFSPYYRIGAHMTEALRAHERLSRGQCRGRITDALERVGLDPLITAERYPFQLSGGQLQRVVLAPALMGRPKLLIADEPTTALDAATQADVLERVDDLRRSTGCAVLFITHDLRCVSARADRIAVMRRGRIVETGPTSKVVADPQDPYTRNLFASVPMVDQDLDRLPVLDDPDDSTEEAS